MLQLISQLEDLSNKEPLEQRIMAPYDRPRERVRILFLFFIFFLILYILPLHWHILASMDGDDCGNLNPMDSQTSQPEPISKGKEPSSTAKPKTQRKKKASKGKQRREETTYRCHFMMLLLRNLIISCRNESSDGSTSDSTDSYHTAGPGDPGDLGADDPDRTVSFEAARFDSCLCCCIDNTLGRGRRK